MYDVSDPRASLTRDSVAGVPASGLGSADCLKFYEVQPSVREAEEETWIARGQNFVLCYTTARAGAVLARSGQPDEYAVLLPDAGMRVEISCAGEHRESEGESLVFVPPGNSEVRVRQGGRVVRVFTNQAKDLIARAMNAQDHRWDLAAIAPVVSWPKPKDGYRIRAYSLNVPPEKGRFGRIWRCTTLMINVLDPFIGPRDVTKLSPHHHDDFEQGSLALAGDFVHHLRWPWSTNKMEWREDQHVLCRTPSLAVIPPPVIHTTEAVGSELNQLVDIFCPPRLDFSQRPGWVLNAADYPMPS